MRASLCEQSESTALFGTRNGQIWAASVSQSERLTDCGFKHDVHKNHPPLPTKLSATPLNFYGFSMNMKCEPPSFSSNTSRREPFTWLATRTYDVHGTMLALPPKISLDRLLVSTK